MAAATQPRAEESAATTIDSGTSRSRACSAATWTSASVKRAPARRSEGATDTGGDGGLFTGDILLSPALASSDRGDVLVLVRALPLEPHHRTTVGVVSLGWRGMNPISMQGKHIRTELLLQAK